MAVQIVEVIKYWSQGEITSFIKVWTLVFTSLTYCYFVSKTVSKGFPRLITIIPVIILNLILPLNLHTVHLGGSTAFLLAWLANFKLLMFAFDKGPLLSDDDDDNLFVSLPRFIALACLPIKSNQTEEKKSKGLKPLSNYITKCLFIVLFLKLYDYTDLIHPKFTWVVYSFHIYFGLEIILAIVGGLTKTVLRMELEPQFDEPYLSSSLQEFWGRRWNLMVTRILKPAVYDPILYFASPLIGRKWAPLPAVLGSFLVSGLMHELIFYYLGRNRPSGELTLFFLIHGLCLAIEIGIKKAIKGSGLRLPGLVSVPLTVGFVMTTSFWLFFPEFLRCDSVPRAFGEYAALGAFVKDVKEAFI